MPTSTKIQKRRRKKKMKDGTVIIKRWISSKEINEIPDVNLELRILVPRAFTRRSLLKYAILSWYLPEVSRFELQEYLRRTAERINYPELTIYINSREICFSALFLEYDYRKNDLFGNILQPGVYIWKNNTLLSSEYLEFRDLSESEKKVFSKEKDLRSKTAVPDQILLIPVHPRKPKKKVFRRGYNDHGSRPELDVAIARKEQKYDAYWTEQQLKIENRRVQSKLHQQNRLFEIILWQVEEGIDR